VEKRRSPVLPFLDRDNFLNRQLGKLRHRALKRVADENQQVVRRYGGSNPDDLRWPSEQP
jgi:hypothetical protein